MTTPDPFGDPVPPPASDDKPATPLSREELLAAIVDSADEAVLSEDLDGVVMSWNVAAERLFGYSTEETIGTSIGRIVPPDRPGELRSILFRIASGEQIEALETVRVTRDGRRLDVLLRISPIRDRAGRIVGASTIARAIGSQRRAEVALRESETRFSGLLEATPAAVLMLEADGRVAFVNERAAATFGYERQALLGRPIEDLIPARFRTLHPALRSGYTRDPGTRTMGQGRDLAGLRRDGTEFPVEVGLSSFASGERRFVIAVVADITARKSLEERLHQAQKMESIGRLAGGVAHDFNNLLTVISGFADMLALEVQPGAPAHDDIAAIKGAAEQATALTQQLLAFSRRQMLQPRVLDLNEAVQRLEPMLRRLIGEHIELAVETRLDAGSVRADPAQLEQVILNLAINARDAMPDGGRLTIETSSVVLDAAYALMHREILPGRYAEIAVIDTGTGMDEKTAQQIFEPFFTTKELGHGTGLGLATTYGSVRQHGGHVAVESKLGQGSTFRVFLPVATDPVVQADQPDSSPLPRGTETILVVEDNPGVRELARTVLARQGYRVLVATRGDEAIITLDEIRRDVDLLVTDVVMPGLSGFALAAAAREMVPGLRTLFLSGYAEETLGSEARVVGPDGFLAKPFTPDALARRVREMLGSPGRP